MKRRIFILTTLFLITALAYGQTEKRYNDYLVKEKNPVILKYTDPYFPTDSLVPGVKNDRMEEYAKLHQPIPLPQNTGNLEADRARCDEQQALWLQQNPYYPQFVPYHWYNHRLTPEDDVILYQAALAAWKKANPTKAEEINNTVK